MCNLCGADDTKILYNWGIYNVVRCEKCGLIYRNPMPLKLEGGTSLHPVRNEIFRRQIGKIERMVRKGSILDVGCGYGDFLRIVRERGWRVAGVEISSECCRFAKEVYGLEVFNKDLRQINFPDDCFDLVTMWDALDCMRDPSGELSEVKRILKPHGLLFIRVRNGLFHISIKRTFRNSRTVVHLYSFTPGTMRLMLKKAGFKEIKVMNSRITTIVSFSPFLNLAVASLNVLSKVPLIFSPSLAVYARN